MAAKIFVGNLAFSTTRNDLEALFGEVGAIKDVFLPTERGTGRPRGFAFVEFETEEEAQQAIEKFDGRELGGRSLRVNAAEDRPRSPQGFGGDRPPYGGPPAGRPKGSRRNVRARKRSL
jgi:cold-inducible RNA-binding protein